MNIDRIDISTNNIKLSILPKENKLIKGTKTTTISDEEIDDLIRIICTWKKDYYSSKHFDGPRFQINIYSNGKLDIIKGTRKLPDNYEEFSNFVRVLYDRR